MAGVSVFCKEERRDDWKKADTEDTVSPCTPSEDLEDSQRLSSLERIKRSIIKLIGSADTLPTEGFYD